MIVSFGKKDKSFHGPPISIGIVRIGRKISQRSLGRLGSETLQCIYSQMVLKRGLTMTRICT